MGWGEKFRRKQPAPFEAKDLTQNPYCPGVREILRIFLIRLFRIRSPVYQTIRQFALRFESELGSQALGAGAEPIRIELEPTEPVVRSVRFGPERKKIFLEEYEPLWSFAQEIGLRKILLDPRLGRKQIQDVFGFLFTYRYDLSGNPNSHETPACVRALGRAEGVFLNRLRITLRDSVLRAASVFGPAPYSDIDQAPRPQEQTGKEPLHIRAEIQKAKAIQKRMLPDLDRLPFRDRIQWAGKVVPSAKAGGDFFDVRQADAGKLAFLFCDVSGDGMSAACTAAVIKTSFGACLSMKLSLRAMAEHLNVELCRLTGAEDFAAAFLGMYNPSTHILMYCNTGQIPEPWRIPADPAEPIRPLGEARNLLLGVEAKTEYKTARCRLTPGDKLTLVSNGVVYAEDRDGRAYGLESLEPVFRRHRTEPIRDLVERIVHSVQEFIGSSEPKDDWAVLAAEILG